MKFAAYILLMILCSCGASSEQGHIELGSQQATVKENGDFVEYFDNGQIKMKGALVNEKREGHWETYYPSGIKQSESDYSKGKLNGKTASFFPNGKPRYVGYYTSDQKSGTWYFYNENGDFQKEATFENGKEVK